MAHTIPHAVRLLETPLGPYRLTACAQGLSHVRPMDAAALEADAQARGDAASRRHLDQAARLLDAYFEGRRPDFGALPLALAGTSFQRRVWQALREIPFGATASYGEIARRIGHAGAARAVGGANHDNALSIVVPCHRVIGADGTLTGYAGGVERKRWLLRHEGALLT